MLQVETSVFERSGCDELSRRIFYLILGLIIAWGFLCVGVTSANTAAWHLNIWMSLGVWFCIPIGMMFNVMGDHSCWKFFGFSIVTVAFGVILGPLPLQYQFANTYVMAEASYFITGVVGAVALSNAMLPKLYESSGGAFYGGTISLLCVSVLVHFIPELGSLTTIHYVVAYIFVLYVSYYMKRAHAVPATLDNVFDVAASLYIDVVELFLWPFGILSKHAKD